MNKKKGPRPNIVGGFVSTGRDKKIRSTDIVGMFEEIEGNCACIGISCCPIPHYYSNYNGVKLNLWINNDTKAAVVGTDEEMDTYYKTLT